jgi:hypothetical protein
MERFLTSVAPELVGGFLAIICAVIGAKIATKSSEHQVHKKELIDAYSEVLSNCYICALDLSDKHKMQLIVSAERAGLICSESSEQIMRNMLLLLADENPNIEEFSEQIKNLRISAKEDVSNANRKKYRAKDK